jgi:hypothetical protein
MTYNTLPRGFAAGLLVAGVTATILAGCTGTAPGELGENQQILTTCPTDAKLGSLAYVDATGSGRSETTDREYLAVIESVARRTAVCGGRLTVAAFSASSGSTVPIFDQEISLHGATDNARLRGVPEKVTEIMDEIGAQYNDAMNAAPAGGTDVTGLYRLAGEHQRQLGSHYQLNFVILTDGLSNLGISTEQVLSSEEAVSLADEVTVPELAGASVSVTGLGRVAGNPLPSRVIDGLVSFYDALCAKTGASKCLSVTDWR